MPALRTLASTAAIGASLAFHPTAGKAQLVSPPHPRVTFSPVASPKAILSRRDERGTRGQAFFVTRPKPAVPMLLAQLQQRQPRLVVGPQPGRVYLVQPIRPRVIFGPTSPPRPLLIRADQRGTAGRAILTAPPHPLFFRLAGPFVFGRLVEKDQRGTAGRAILAMPPRPLVAFGPARVAMPRLVRTDQRGQSGRFWLVPARKFNPAPVKNVYRANLLGDSGYAGKLLS